VDEHAWTYQKLFIDASRLETPDHVVVNHVGPASLELEKRGWIDDFFFLRYAEGGLHIRHRVRLTGAVEGATVGTYLRDAAQRVDGVVGVEEANYERETLKYGGVRGLDICERAFCESSRLTISCIGRTTGNLNLRVVVAVFLFDALLSAAEIYGTARAAVLDAYAGYWKAISTQWQRVPSSDTQQPRATLVATLAEQLEKSDGQLGAVADLIGPVRAPWLSRTAAQMSEIKALASVAQLKTPIENIVCNLAHTTNNRLGLGPLDEVLIAELLLLADGLRRTASE
jgi:thiopeptide-type bacteriocin biosynthesis protein